jgi:hypothetical protein
VVASNIAEGYNFKFYYTCTNGPQVISSVLLTAKQCKNGVEILDGLI